MIKRFNLCLLIVVLVLTSFSSIFAYSNKYFSIDIPEEYQKMEQDKVWLFISSKSESAEDLKAMFIYIMDSKNAGSNLRYLSQEDIDELLADSSEGKDYEIVYTNRDAKLGKEDAIQVDAQTESAYMRMYVLGNNKYAYIVMLMATDKTTLDSSEFKQIEDSFKIVGGASGSNSSYIFLIIAIVVIVVAIKTAGKKKGAQEDITSDYGNE